MSGNLLVAVDGSKGAMKAVELGAEIAASRKAVLHLVHVVPSVTPPEALREWGRVERTAEASQWMYAESVADNVLNAAEDLARKAGVDLVEKHAERGDPAKQIVEAAKYLRADMLVVGTRGLGDLQGLILGSVAHKVMHHSPCTVITVRETVSA